jgi:RNA polymerase sigma-70 factor (ECF subfamily)
MTSPDSGDSERYEAARAAWPTVAIPQRAFLDYLEERRARDQRHLAELYLACGCLLGNAAALQQLEERFLSQVGGFVGGIDRSPDFADEVRQALREHLFVAREGRAPSIAEYTGKGALSGWLRVSAQRIALNLRRGRNPPPELAGDERVAPRNPELEYLQKSSQAEFGEALRAALSALTAHERNLLRLHFVDGLSTTEIAPLFRAHRTTIRRQINECQEKLIARMRESLRARLNLSDSQVDSLLREGRKSLELSLSTLL